MPWSTSGTGTSRKRRRTAALSARVYGQTGQGRSQIYGDVGSQTNKKWQADLTATTGSKDFNVATTLGLLTGEQIANIRNRRAGAADRGHRRGNAVYQLHGEESRDVEAAESYRDALAKNYGEEVLAGVNNLQTLTTAREAFDRFSNPEPAADGIYLSDIEWKSWKMFGATSADDNPAYTPSRNCNEAGGTLTIAGKEYQKGLRTHPDAAYPAEIVYNISGYDFTTFSATVGKDSAASYGYGYVQFLVLCRRPVKRGQPLLEAGEDCYLGCNVEGGKELKLVLTNGGDVITHDSGGWGNAMLDNRSCTLEESGLSGILPD